jgi:hypothetical protein
VIVRELPERGRAIDQDVGVPVAHGFERLPEHELALRSIHQLDLRADQILARGRHVEIGEVYALLDDGVDRQLVDEGVVDRPRGFVAGDSEPARRVPLGIHVDHEDGPFGDGQRRAEVDGRRGLPDSALLVGDRYDPGHSGFLRGCGG